MFYPKCGDKYSSKNDYCAVSFWVEIIILTIFVVFIFEGKAQTDETIIDGESEQLEVEDTKATPDKLEKKEEKIDKTDAQRKLKELGILFNSVEFIEQVEANNKEVVKLFLDAGIDPNKEDLRGRTALSIAVEYGYIELTRLLLDYGAKPNKELLFKVIDICTARNGYYNAEECKEFIELFIGILSEAEYVNKKVLFGKALLLINRVWNSSSEEEELLREKRIYVVKALLSAGADINAKDDSGLTALWWAVKTEYADIIDLLISAGADVNIKNHEGITPLMIACSQNSPEIAMTLISAGADVNAKSKKGVTPLMFAIDIRGKFEIDRGLITTLIARGADVNAKNEDGATPLMFAADAGAPEIVNLLLAAGAEVNVKNKSGHTALMLAVASSECKNKGQNEGGFDCDYEGVIRVLLEGNADVNAKSKDGSTALMLAVKKDYVELLLAHGADVNARNNKGETALMQAVCAPDIVKALLSAGANINTKSKNGDTALIYAVEKNCGLEAIKVLLLSGVEVNEKDNVGDTALIIATRNFEVKIVADGPRIFMTNHWGEKEVEIVELLLSAGANPNIKNNKGETALKIAQRMTKVYRFDSSTCREIVDLLKSAGAK